MGWKAVKDHYGLKGLVVHCAHGVMYLSRAGDSLQDPIALLTTGELAPVKVWTQHELVTQRLVFEKDPELFASLVTQEDVFTEPLVTLYAVEGETVHARQAVATPEELVLLDGTRFDPARHFHSASDADIEVLRVAGNAYRVLANEADKVAELAARLKEDAFQAWNHLSGLARAHAKREKKAIQRAAWWRGKTAPPWHEADAAQRRGILGRMVLIAQQKGDRLEAIKAPVDKVRWQLEDYLALPGATQPDAVREDGLVPTVAQQLAVLQGLLATEEYIPVTWVRLLLVEYGSLVLRASDQAVAAGG